MTTIGERLKEERTRLGMNQTDFAMAGGVQKHAQIRYEKGERSPDGNYFEAVSKIGVDVLYVLTGRKEPNINVITEELEGTVSPVRMAMITLELHRQFERNGITSEMFETPDIDYADSGITCRSVRIALLAAEIYNELFLEPPLGSIKDTIKNLAYGMALAERSRIRSAGED
ncbi:XRE family transcriptional regulator [Salmonella enterica subsp. enterica serovar Oranienburg]|nr:XRE family transcriptional regulator [Salmonella enterica subsp. enterica serovar Oranienburg]ECD5542856.1 XRE family transcriptional regulator [Salmonella enterica subsp. enterica serovar Kokomlemle]HAF2283656.1 helix-turn-helix transcriptional regulator [Salmonella enterica]EBX4923442.1 XRE family transcriptional regulator [Salmonella enterica subsp. enterica serovar Oranienburg]EDT5580046.1 helix-turn-helix transcriptional regulator [Salmonella enterica subsp. enterica serovar Kokomlemle]